MLAAVVRTLVARSRRERSISYRLLALTGGAILLLCLFPALLTWVGGLLAVPPRSVSPLTASLVIGLGMLPGLYVLGWTARTLWRRGGSATSPSAPIRRLVVEGPYRLCRNPIDLGAVLYCLGFGTLFGSLGAGIFASLVTLVLESAYHRWIEERALLARFGDEYRRYRARTPFLIPSLAAWLERRR